MSSPRTPETPRSTRSSRSRTTPRNDEASSELARLDSSTLSSPVQGRVKSSDMFSSPKGMQFADVQDSASSPLNYGTPSSLATPGIRSTPMKVRADVLGVVGNTETHQRVESYSQSNDPNRGVIFIWGTNVEVDRLRSVFQKFIQEFVLDNVEDDERIRDFDQTKPYYLQKLAEIKELRDDPCLNLNCAHLQMFDAEVYTQLICYPAEVIPTMDLALHGLFCELYPDAQLEHQIFVRPFNCPQSKNLRSLNPEDIEQIVSVTGLVIRTSNVIPELREAFFRCSICSSYVTSKLDRGRIPEPTLCQHCNSSHSFTIVHNLSSFSDKQLIKLQEAPGDMPAGETPHTVLVYAHHELVDSVSPGDRVTLTGVYRASALRMHPFQRNVKAVYKTYVDALHFRKVDVKRFRTGEAGLNILNEERVSQILALPKRRPDLYERLAAALAPSIYEHEDVKKGVLLQLFGGTSREDAGAGHFRPNLNILLCGDPGTSKSQLLQYVYNTMPRSQYTSGKGSSAVGLTAYVTRDPETRQFLLQTGALVLADGGVCCIDEFDKMTDSTRSVLHEVMEQQTLSIAKAGIICTLNARTSVLAAANPVESQWNKNKTIIDNIMLPHTLLSRFDLIFLLLDPQDEAYDRRLATHLVSLYYRGESASEDELMDMSLLRDYLTYARSCIFPELSDEASQELVSVYVQMRKMGSGRGQISAYPRQLESLIRLSEAHAKMRLSQVVEVHDVQEAWRLHREALKQSAVDPSTGKIDISILTTGMSGEARKRCQELAKVIHRIIAKKGIVHVIKVKELFEEIRSEADVFISKELFNEALRALADEDQLVITGNTIRPLGGSRRV